MHAFPFHRGQRPSTATAKTLSDTNLGLCLTKYFRWACVFHRPPHLQEEAVDILGYLTTYAPKLLLEVCGAAGAVWGSAQCYTLRTTGNTNDFWRPICLITFAFYLTRFYLHSKHFLEHAKDYPPIKHQHRRLHFFTFFEIHSTKFLLEVLGATGAVWGSMEALTLRNDSNIEQWRLIATLVGLVFFIRWICLILSYCLCEVMLWIESKPILNMIFRWLDLIVAKFILEVLGAAGAAWGFSEIVGLRKPDTMYIWRPISISVGVVFLLRWIWQLRAVWVDEQRQEVPMSPVGPKNTTEEETQDLELGDLALTEIVDTAKGDTTPTQSDG